jgi:DNA-binding MarR family transcriptional regulator
MEIKPLETKIKQVMNADQLLIMTSEIRILCMLITKTSARAIEDRLSLSGVELNGLQYGVMRCLSYHAHTLSELSKMFVLDPSTLVPIIDSLERRGLLRRERDPSDRRRMPLSLTEEGMAVMKQVANLQHDDVLFRSLQQLGPQRAEQLLELLRAIIHELPDGPSMLHEVQSHVQRHAQVLGNS